MPDSDHTIALQLLGGFALRCHGSPVTLTGPGQQLAACVALGRTRRSGLTRALFPDSDDSHATGRFRTTLWRVGMACPGLLVVSGPSVRLGDEVDVDVARLTSWAAGVADGCVGDWSFLTLDNWDLLPEVDEDWVNGERERLRELRFHALIDAADLLRRCGRLGAAMQAALACVAEEPLRESGQRAAIAVHLAENDVDAAACRYDRFAALLRRELGVAPSGSLGSLLEEAGLQRHPRPRRLASARSS